MRDAIEHPAGQRVLGVIDANLSLATVNQQSAQQQANLAWFLAGAILMGSVLATAFIWIVVHRPVKELIDGTHRVAGGDLDYRLPVAVGRRTGRPGAFLQQNDGELDGVQRAEIEERVRRKTAELEKMHKTLLSSEKMASIGKLSATVAHEINNPLFGILTYARLVLRSLRSWTSEGATRWRNSCRSLSASASAAAIWSRICWLFRGKRPSHRERHDLNAVVQRAVLLVKHKLDLQNIELEDDLAEGCRRWNATATRFSR